MHAARKNAAAILRPLLAAIMILACLWAPAAGLALMPLPDIGIEYQTMKVNRAERLIAAGRKEARNGDAVSMRIAAEGAIIFKNLRTAEELTYPPAKRNAKPPG